MTRTGPSSWRGRTAMPEWLLGLCAKLLRYCGPQGAWLLCRILSPAYMLVGGRGQFGMPAYWRALGQRRGASLRLPLLWRQNTSFARILCDRVLLPAHPEAYRLQVAGGAAFRELMDGPGGVILISAHVGNWELSSWCLPMVGGRPRAVHLVMVQAELPFAQGEMDRRLRSGIHLIDPRTGIAAGLAVGQALAAGGVVCMLADRVMPGQAAVEVPFLGHRVRMPTGPFQAAVASGAPLVPCFMLRRGRAGYDLLLGPALYVTSSRAGRAAAVTTAAATWARMLECVVRHRPLQWHNFYNYFQPEPR